MDENGGVKTYCVYDAPSEEVVRSHAVYLGKHDIAWVQEIAGDVTPDDFPLDGEPARPSSRPADSRATGWARRRGRGRPGQLPADV